MSQCVALCANIERGFETFLTKKTANFGFFDRTNDAHSSVGYFPVSSLECPAIIRVSFQNTHKTFYFFL